MSGFLTSMQTGTSGSSFTIIALLFYTGNIWLYLAKNPDVFLICLIHAYSGPEELVTL